MLSLSNQVCIQKALKTVYLQFHRPIKSNISDKVLGIERILQYVLRQMELLVFYRYPILHDHLSLNYGTEFCSNLFLVLEEDFAVFRILFLEIDYKHSYAEHIPRITRLHRCQL